MREGGVPGDVTLIHECKGGVPMGLFSRRIKSDPTPPLEAGTRATEILSRPFTGMQTGPAVYPEPGQRKYPDVPTWFRRLGDVPRLDVEFPDAAPRSALPGCNERPWVYFGGGPAPEPEFRHLQWPGSHGFGEWGPNDFGHTWSPAQRMFFGVEQAPGRSASQILIGLWPALERPGTGLDYHFLLQGAVEELWKIRESDPDARSSIITVASIDQRLATALPECMLIEPDQPGRYLTNRCIERLAAVYEQLGDLDSAFEVTTFASQFGQLDSRHRRLAKKLGKPLPE
jgi:hypothetical protein